MVRVIASRTTARGCAWDGKYRGRLLKNTGGFPNNTNNTRILRFYDMGILEQKYSLPCCIYHPGGAPVEPSVSYWARMHMVADTIVPAIPKNITNQQNALRRTQFLLRPTAAVVST